MQTGQLNGKLLRLDIPEESTQDAVFPTAPESKPMDNPRSTLLDWAAQGHLAPEALYPAMVASGALPSRPAWQRGIDRLLLWAGTLFLAASLVFFLAYNWQDLGHYAKFALAEGAVLLALAGVWHQGLERPGGKAALLGASLALGALLALVGQTYQTGADTYELFASWALMLLPWVLLGRCAPLWLLWLLLVNLAIVLYFQLFPGRFLGRLLGAEQQLWLLFAWNTLAQLLWELAARHGITWLQPRWGARLLACAGGAMITALAVLQVTDWHGTSVLALPVWLLWLTASGWIYRRRQKDLFMLAGGALSLILVVSSFFVDWLSFRHGSGFLLVGLLVIGLSAAAGWWLKRVAAEEAP